MVPKDRTSGLSGLTIAVPARGSSQIGFDRMQGESRPASSASSRPSITRMSMQNINGSTPTLAVRDSQDHSMRPPGKMSMSGASTALQTPDNMSKTALDSKDGGAGPSPLSQSVTASADVDVEAQAPKKGKGPAGGPPAAMKQMMKLMEDEAEKNFKPKTAKFWLIMLSNFVALFLVALDRTIIATAIPRITDDFGSLGDIGWYGSSYMLTTAASQLLFGRIYKFYDLKWSFLVSIIIFEAGSVICGAAPTSPIFITGRAIAGFGSAGIFTGAMMVMIPMVPLHKRPMFQGIFGMVFGLSSVIGPLVGGGFTSSISWRWCFYINLPVGGVALILLFIFLKSPPSLPGSKGPVTIKQQILRLDPLGTFFFLPSIVALLLALQWGGSEYEWSDPRIISLFAVFGAMFIGFSLVQVLMPKTATVPVRVITQRTMLAGSFFMFFLAGSMMLAIYYVPLWFQAVQGADPVKSGIYTIPLVLSIVISSFISGFGTQRIGYYVPSMILCPCIMAVGLGLMGTFQTDTDPAHWISYQFLTGFGLGFGMQTVGLAVQTVLPKEDISTGIAISFFAQQLGAAVFISVGQAILSNLLISELSLIPSLDPSKIINSGATDLHRIVPEVFLPAVAAAYNFACTRIFITACGLSAGTLICAAFMEWRSIKKGKQGPPARRRSSKKAARGSPVVGIGPVPSLPEIQPVPSIPSIKARQYTPTGEKLPPSYPTDIEQHPLPVRHHSDAVRTRPQTAAAAAEAAVVEEQMEEITQEKSALVPTYMAHEIEAHKSWLQAELSQSQLAMLRGEDNVRPVSQQHYGGSVMWP